MYSLMCSHSTDILKSFQVLSCIKAGLKTDTLTMETKQVTEILVSELILMQLITQEQLVQSTLN
jgi:hypothetical protein